MGLLRCAAQAVPSMGGLPCRAAFAVVASNHLPTLRLSCCQRDSPAVFLRITLSVSSHPFSVPLQGADSAALGHGNPVRSTGDVLTSRHCIQQLQNHGVSHIQVSHVSASAGWACSLAASWLTACQRRAPCSCCLTSALRRLFWPAESLLRRYAQPLLPGAPQSLSVFLHSVHLRF